MVTSIIVLINIYIYITQLFFQYDNMHTVMIKAEMFAEARFADITDKHLSKKLNFQQNFYIYTCKK